MEKRIHVVGPPHVPVREAYSTCAFVTLAKYFCRMLVYEGWNVTYYGTEGDEIQCQEFVQVQPFEQMKLFWPENVANRYTHSYKDKRGGIEHFDHRLKRELRKRIEGREIVASIFNSGARFLNQMPEAITVDPFVGYSNPWAKYNVFPSRAHRGYVYGKHEASMTKYWRDAMIPHFVDVGEYFYVSSKREYALFMARLPNFNKGLYVAMETCRKKDVPLKVAGLFFNERMEKQALYHISQYTNVEYIGPVSGVQKKSVLSEAMCFFAPTFYHEPFGLVAVEALASGTPVISTDWGGLAEIVKHGVTGYRCRYERDFDYAIEEIRSLSPRDCRKRAEKSYSILGAGKEYDRYLRRVIEVEKGSGNLWYNGEN